MVSSVLLSAKKPAFTGELATCFVRFLSYATQFCLHLTVKPGFYGFVVKLKEAYNIFSGLRVDVLRSKFRTDGKRFPSYHITSPFQPMIELSFLLVFHQQLFFSRRQRVGEPLEIWGTRHALLRCSVNLPRVPGVFVFVSRLP